MFVPAISLPLLGAMSSAENLAGTQKWAANKDFFFEFFLAL